MRKPSFALLYFIVPLGIILAFIFGQTYGPQTLSQTAQLFQSSSPTPTPDQRALIGQTISVGQLYVQINQAWRIKQPNANLDLAIIQVTISGGEGCSAAPSQCLYHKDRFHLTDSLNQTQSPSVPPLFYIPNFKVLKLTDQRQLTTRTSETGQIYFLLDANDPQYTLIYTHTNGKSASFALTFDQLPTK